MRIERRQNKRLHFHVALRFFADDSRRSLGYQIPNNSAETKLSINCFYLELELFETSEKIYR